jgi:hypothetical protein
LTFADKTESGEYATFENTLKKMLLNWEGISNETDAAHSSS